MRFQSFVVFRKHNDNLMLLLKGEAGKQADAAAKMESKAVDSMRDRERKYALRSIMMERMHEEIKATAIEEKVFPCCISPITRKGLQKTDYQS